MNEKNIDTWIGFVQFGLALKGDKYHKSQRKGNNFAWENSNKSMLLYI